MTTPAERRQHWQTIRQIHSEGWQAREEGQPKSVCPEGLDFEWRQWWIAGWIAGWLDRDQELDTRREA